MRLANMVRRFPRWPAVVLGATLTLGLGVGVSAGVLSFIQYVVAPALRGEYALDLQRMVRVPAVKTYAAYRATVERVRTVDMGVYHRTSVGIGRGASAVPLRLECVSRTYLRLLGVHPMIGRTFAALEGANGEPPVLLLGHRFWTLHFDGDPGVLGTMVDVNGRQYRVIGVVPRDFGGVESPGADAWTLLAASPLQCLGSLDGWQRSTSLQVVGKMREPFTGGQVSSEIESLRSFIAELNGPLFPIGTGAPVFPLYYPELLSQSPERRILRWVGAGSAAVLLLACGNVSVLLLLGVARRRDEMETRLRLGARRRQIFTKVLGEALVIGVGSAVPAAIIATWTVMLMRTLVPSGTVSEILGPHGIQIVAAIAMGAGLVSGIGPALAAARTRVYSLEKKRRTLAQNALLAAQVAATLVLVIVAGLFARSIAAVRRDIGYDLQHVIVASLELERAGVDVARAHEVFNRLQQRMLREPAVHAASVSSQAPIGFSSDAVLLRLPGGVTSMVSVSYITPSYFTTMGTRLLAGRHFGPDDTSGAVMVVNEALAKRLWPSGDALGACAFVGFSNPECMEVIGISESRRAERITEVNNEIFVPLSRDNMPRVLLVRTRSSAETAVGAVAVAIRDEASALPFVDVRPIADRADEQTRALRLATRMANFFSVIALALTGIGIYSAMAVSIRERRFEVGIRMAVGASRGDIAWLVMRRSVAILAVGWIVGGAASIFLVPPGLDALLFGVAPRDTATFLWGSVVVGFSVIAGSVGPVVHALKVPPTLALRR